MSSTHSSPQEDYKTIDQQMEEQFVEETKLNIVSSGSVSRDVDSNVMQISHSNNLTPMTSLSVMGFDQDGTQIELVADQKRGHDETMSNSSIGNSPKVFIQIDLHRTD